MCVCVCVCVCACACMRVREREKERHSWPWQYRALHNRGGNAMKKDESWDWTEDTLTASGFRSAVFVWAAATDTNTHTRTLTHTHTHAQNTCTLGLISGFGFENLMSSNCQYNKKPKLKCHTINGVLFFNSAGRWGHHALSQARASLLPATKCPPDTKPSCSYQRTPTALPTNVTSFPFPPTTKTIKENLTHLYLAKWNKNNNALESLPNFLTATSARDS